MEIATADYFCRACVKVGIGFTVNSNNLNKEINIEWICNAARKVYINIHNPKSTCTRFLTSSFNNSGKLAVDTKLVDSVVSYLSNFKTACTALTHCSSGRCACKSDCKDCDCNCVMCVDCNCCNACPCNCACDCGSDCECFGDCSLWPCNCSLNKCATSVCNQNCDCHCTCDNCKAVCCDDCCFITTAVCETLGKPDDCYELTMFREFRDEYLKNQPDGETLIVEYYQIAPIIVFNIDQLPDRKQIYLNIWEKWLSPCLKLLELKKFDECKEKYQNMVKNLEEIYIKNRE